MYEFKMYFHNLISFYSYIYYLKKVTPCITIAFVKVVFFDVIGLRLIMFLDIFN